MVRVFIAMIVVLVLASCSVLILNHSHGNVIDDVTKPLITPKVTPNIEMSRERDWHIGKEITDTTNLK